MYTNEQQKIIHHEEGCGLAGAVPGAGKSLSLCGRVRYLINKQIPAKNILLLTYSKVDPIVQTKNTLI
jgi:superfamily I DNA/RNA helicase